MRLLPTTLAAALVAAAFAFPVLAQDRSAHDAAARGQALAVARGCGLCHGEQGISATAMMPSLAGQHADYSVLQMVLFREGLRAVPVMQAAMAGLSDQQLTDLAEHYAALPPGPPPDRAPRDAEVAAQGAAISPSRNCNACHLPSYAGRVNVPRLAAQREDYLAAAMIAYRDNLRVGADTQMNGLMLGLTNAEIAALAHHLAHQ